MTGFAVPPGALAVANPKARRRSTGMEAFATETLELLARIIAADWVSMYLIDENGTRVEIGSRGIPASLFEPWREKHKSWIGAITLPRQHRGWAGVVCLREDNCAEPARGVTYGEFLRGCDIVDAAEMLFVHADEVVGDISLMWTTRARRSHAQESATLRDLQRYIQFNFVVAWHSTTVGRRRRITHELRLTPRESQLVESLCAGQTNAELAEQFNITLATVKSHLGHIFNKLGVCNRTALIEKAMRMPAQD